MNLQALLDGVLAAVALTVAIHPARHWPALRLGCLVLAAAATLGTLRFSGWLPLPPMHQFMSMLGAGVGLPLIGISLASPTSAVSRQTRYAWIFAVSSSVICILAVMVWQFKLWPSVCAVLATLAVLFYSIQRRDWLAMTVGACLLVALVMFASKLETSALVPGDFLHIGLALGLVLTGRWSHQHETK